MDIVLDPRPITLTKDVLSFFRQSEDFTSDQFQVKRSYSGSRDTYLGLPFPINFLSIFLTYSQLPHMILSKIVLIAQDKRNIVIIFVISQRIKGCGYIKINFLCGEYIADLT